MFLIYINNLSNGLSLNCRLFDCHTSLLSVVNNIYSTAATVSNDKLIISNLALQWKMIFNPDLTKQAQDVILSRKTKILLLHLTFSFIFI